MNCPWAALLETDDLARFASLRLRDDVEVLQESGRCWLRGADLDDELDLGLRAIGELERYEVDREGWLRRPGNRLPDGRLPSGDWLRLKNALPLPPQPASRFDPILEPVALELVRSSQELPAKVLLTTACSWYDHALQAAEVRLEPLRFAASEAGLVAVHGTPLPPVRGRRFSERQGVCAPCGFCLHPVDDPAIVREALRLEEGDVALFDPDVGHRDPAARRGADYQIIAAEEFVQASRSAVRLTWEARPHD